MARSVTPHRKIRIMISSQCRRCFPAGGRTLTEIRQEVRDRLESAKLLGAPVFEVWINEDAPAGGLDENSWEACLAQVRRADILIVLDAGHAGWARSAGDIGICHAELSTAADAAPGKVRIVPIRRSEPLDDEDAASNARFAAYVERLNAFSPPVRTEESLHRAVDAAVIDAVTGLAALGVREARKGRFHSGDALEWSRLGFAERQERMIDAASAALVESGGEKLGEGLVAFPIADSRIGLQIHASPASLALAASRELVGRPFLRDHLLVAALPIDVVGPVHLIACQAGATDAQARAMLGFPDAQLVTAPFGVFVADEVQQIQFALLRDCRDDTTTRSAVHRLLDWLRESGEETQLAARAARRRRIADAIAAEARSR